MDDRRSLEPVTAIICTRNRGESLVATVRSILQNADPHVELVVVDQSTDDRTEQALTAFIGDHRLHYLRSQTEGKGRAQNIGLAASHSEIVALTDDDCEVPPDWLQVMADVLIQNPGAAVAFCNVDAAPHDRTAGFVPAYHGPSEVITSLGRTLGIGAGMAIRRSAVLALGGFDEMLGPGGEFSSGDEHDIATRALLRGYQVVHTNQVAVSHYGYRTWEEGRELTRRDCRAAGAVTAKFFTLRNRHLLLSPVVTLLRFLQLAVRDSIRFRRPSGVARITSFVRGFIEGWQVPVDQVTMRFIPPPPAAPKDAAPTFQPDG